MYILAHILRPDSVFPANRASETGLLDRFPVTLTVLACQSVSKRLPYTTVLCARPKSISYSEGVMDTVSGTSGSGVTPGFKSHTCVLSALLRFFFPLVPWNFHAPSVSMDQPHQRELGLDRSHGIA